MDTDRDEWGKTLCHTTMTSTKQRITTCYMAIRCICCIAVTRQPSLGSRRPFYFNNIYGWLWFFIWSLFIHSLQSRSAFQLRPVSAVTICFPFWISQFHKKGSDSSRDLELWSWTVNFMQCQDERACEISRLRSFRLKVVVRTHRQTDTQLTDCHPRSLKWSVQRWT